MTTDDSSAPRPSASASPAQRAALEAARERMIRLLTDRFADDTLTIEEFEARLDLMYAASSIAEIDALTRDLVAAPAVVDPRAGVAQPYGAPPRPYAAPYDAAGEPPALRRTLAVLSETRRTGRWIVPRRLDVRALMGEMMLDLREATLPPGLCEIDIVAVMSNVKILVPPGIIVEGLLTSVMGAVGNDAEDDGRLPANALRVRLTGMAFMSEVRVRVAQPGEPARAAWRHARQRRGW